MDDETVVFLSNAALESYREIFERNKIGINEIAHIKADQLPALIGPIGDQVPYKKAIDVHNAKQATVRNVGSRTAERMTEPSAIQSFYAGKTVFITGGSGLMGKVLIEKLLYSCSDLARIYVLLRPKRGSAPDARVNDIFTSPMFERIRNEKPAVMKKVTAIHGDVSLENLGISEVQRGLLINEAQIVFHCAATVRLEAGLKDAIELNTIGTASMLQLAKNMKNLLVFVHVSTAFCHVDQHELGECVYDPPDEPRNVMRLVKWLDESALDLITPKLLGANPNTYTYSKRLAESLVEKEYPNLPCVIARPSIVSPACNEPFPGWVDNLNGPVGIIVGGGKGIIRSMHCNANYRAQIIPVDFAINAFIAIACKVSSKGASPRLKGIPVYNVTQSGLGPIKWGETLTHGRIIVREYPFEGGIWYPDGNIRSSKFIHSLFVLFFHLLPAYLIDFLMLVFRQKPFMVRIQKRISNGLDVLQYFTTREWVFHNTNFLSLGSEMGPKDKLLFPIDFLNMDLKDYIKVLILGTRQYCMKEKLESLPRARRHQKMLYAIHIIVVYSFYFGILYFVYNKFETVRFGLDFVGDKIKALPIVGNLLKWAHL